jgi:hypothetical protein
MTPAAKAADENKAFIAALKALRHPKSALPTNLQSRTTQNRTFPKTAPLRHQKSGHTKTPKLAHSKIGCPRNCKAALPKIAFARRL